MMGNFVKKINTYYLEKLIKGDKLYYQIDKDKIYISDSYSIVILDRHEFFININLMKEIDLKHFIDSLDLEKYNKVDEYINYKDKYIKLRFKEIELLIDKKYFKLFEKLDFKIKQDIQPVLCYENENLRVFLLPIKEYKGSDK